MKRKRYIDWKYLGDRLANVAVGIFAVLVVILIAFILIMVVRGPAEPTPEYRACVTKYLDSGKPLDEAKWRCDQ